jgi:hypothetical protein
LSGGRLSLELGTKQFAKGGELLNYVGAAIQDGFRELFEVAGRPLAEFAQGHDDGEGVIDTVLHLSVLRVKGLEFGTSQEWLVRVHVFGLLITVSVAKRVPSSGAILTFRYVFGWEALCAFRGGGAMLFWQITTFCPEWLPT